MDSLFQFLYKNPNNLQNIIFLSLEEILGQCMLGLSNPWVKGSDTKNARVYKSSGGWGAERASETTQLSTAAAAAATSSSSQQAGREGRQGNRLSGLICYSIRHQVGWPPGKQVSPQAPSELSFWPSITYITFSPILMSEGHRSESLQVYK